MPRKPKKFTLYVLEYRPTRAVSQAPTALNPADGTGGPVVKVHYTSRPIEQVIAEKLKSPKVRRELVHYRRRKTAKAGILRARDNMIDELRNAGMIVQNGTQRRNYRVYVLELAKEARPTTAQNDGHEPRKSKAVLYVGQTSKTIAARIGDHTSGGQTSSKWVRDHYVKERPELIPSSYQGDLTERESIQFEASLAKRLRKKGHGVRGGK